MRPGRSIVALAAMTVSCSTPEDPNPYCEPTTKTEAPLEEYLIGDWECDFWNVDESTSYICSFGEDGSYFRARIADCESNLGRWGTWSANSDTVEIATVGEPVTYRLEFDDRGSSMLKSSSGESWIELRPQVCTTNCRPDSKPPKE